MNKEYYEETKVKSTSQSQETGKNNLKSPIDRPQKPGKLPNFNPKFNDKKYATRDHKKNQEFGEKEQKPSLLDRLLKIFTETIKNDNMKVDKAEVTHTDGSNAKGISSKVEESNAEKVDSKKLNK